MARSYYQGKFSPRFPQKYRGRVGDITYRSSWELQFMKYLDETPTVIQWNSEEVIIPYISPVDGRSHRYFMDFWFKANTSKGLIEFIVEIKPHAQTLPPNPPKKNTKRFLDEVKTYGVNRAKWFAAESFAKSRGMEFKILTEKNFNFL